MLAGFLTTCLISLPFFPLITAVCRVYQGPISGFGPPGKFRVRNNNIESIPGGEIKMWTTNEYYRCTISDRWDLISDFTDSFFKLHTNPQQPDHTDSECRRHGGYLATVYNMRVNTVMAHIMSEGHVFVAQIGLSDVDSEGEWRWSTGYSAPNEAVLRSIFPINEPQPDSIPGAGLGVVGLNSIGPGYIGRSRYAGYTNWYPTQPNNYGKGEDYVVMTSHFDARGQWFDIGPPESSNPLVTDQFGRRLSPIKVPYWCEVTAFTRNSRIVEGDERSGSLQIEWARGIWYRVCSQGFDEVAAEIACKGFGFELGTFLSYVDFSEDETASVTCQGYERNIERCSVHLLSHCFNIVWLECYEDCPPGSFQLGSACHHCNPGTYKSYTGSHSCSECEQGSYQPAEGAVTCHECPRGLTTRAPGSTTRQDCIEEALALCGQRQTPLYGPTLSLNSNIVRIIGGYDVELGEHPWFASINFRGSSICGGTIINDRTIVTAAHCIAQPPSTYHNICYTADSIQQLLNYAREDDVPREGLDDAVKCTITSKDDITVTVGLVDLKNVRESGVQTRRIREIYISDRFIYPLHNDIAVLKLAWPLRFNERVWPACLPPESWATFFPGRSGGSPLVGGPITTLQSTGSPIEDGTKLTIAGFGYTSLYYTVPSQLQQARVPYVSRDRCNNQLDNHVSGHMICAGFRDGGVDACQGDSGGPLLYLDQEAYTVIGVVSWGESCAEKEKPGVYTSVVDFLDFIKDARDDKIDPSV